MYTHWCVLFPRVYSYIFLHENVVTIAICFHAFLICNAVLVNWPKYKKKKQEKITFTKNIWKFLLVKTGDGYKNVTQWTLNRYDKENNHFQTLEIMWAKKHERIFFLILFFGRKCNSSISGGERSGSIEKEWLKEK